MEIGQKVKVCRIRQPIPEKMINRIKENPIGTITEFKMVDGSGVGFWVQLRGSFWGRSHLGSVTFRGRLRRIKKIMNKCSQKMDKFPIIGLENRDHVWRGPSIRNLFKC